MLSMAFWEVAKCKYEQVLGAKSFTVCCQGRGNSCFAGLSVCLCACVNPCVEIFQTWDCLCPASVCVHASVSVHHSSTCSQQVLVSALSVCVPCTGTNIIWAWDSGERKWRDVLDMWVTFVPLCLVLLWSNLGTNFTCSWTLMTLCWWKDSNQV